MPKQFKLSNENEFINFLKLNQPLILKQPLIVKASSPYIFVSKYLNDSECISISQFFLEIAIELLTISQQRVNSKSYL